MKKKILVIDSANLYHSNKYEYIKGNIDNLIEPFLKQIQTLVQEQFPSIIVLCNDEYKSKYRMNLAKDYKGNRVQQAKKFNKKEKEADLLIRGLKKKLKLFNGIFVYGGVKDVEADDIMSILYHDTRLKDYEIIVVSQDKDLLTTINFHNLYDWKKGRYKNLEDRLGFTKPEWLNFMAIMGDGIDKIGGIKGCGTKTAEKLIKRYSTINNLLKGALEDLPLEEIKKDSYVRKALERLNTQEGIEELKLSYHLVKIMKDKSLLEDYQEKEYEEIVTNIIKFKKPQEDRIISNDLDDFFFENKAFKASDLIKEINQYIN